MCSRICICTCIMLKVVHSVRATLFRDGSRLTNFNLCQDIQKGSPFSINLTYLMRFWSKNSGYGPFSTKAHAYLMERCRLSPEKWRKVKVTQKPSYLSTRNFTLISKMYTFASISLIFNEINAFQWGKVITRILK